MEKPRLSFWQIWNMSFGFMGIQIGFGLQNANASRILQSFGADVEHLSWFWLVAPLTGMIVQPIIGHYSDRTWNRMGRRKPYFLTGALLASLALVLLPNSGTLTAFIPALYVGAGMLMMMDASINVAMEPFRALVADMLPSDQRTLGFSIQTCLIGIGAVIGSWLPNILGDWLDLGQSRDEFGNYGYLFLAFYVGASIFITTILWTIFTTKEYPPEEYNKYHPVADENVADEGFFEIFKDFARMPKTMRQLGLVQFFSWFALFSMWVYMTSAMATHIYGLEANDTQSPQFQEAGQNVGFLFGIYNLVATFVALLLPAIALKLGRKRTHAVSLTAGGLGLISLFFLKNTDMMIFSMVGIGIAWASILAMPYAILAGSIPGGKMGIYMGIFNFFITGPQILNGIIGGPMVKYIYNSQPIYAIVTAGFFLLLGAVAVLFVDDVDEKVVK
ncbi:MAG: MFS transporter [Bacteroidia bacterium]|nr:MFS transporter [Bacteroidia bacterium]